MRAGALGRGRLLRLSQLRSSASGAGAGRYLGQRHGSSTADGELAGESAQPIFDRVEGTKPTLQAVNHLFYENTIESAYATLFFAEYDDRSRRLRYTNCGHYFPLLLRSNGEVERLGSTGTVIGLVEKLECDVDERQLQPGDTLVLFTDGVTESCDTHGEEFGEGRLLDMLRRNLALPTDRLPTSVVDEVRAFSPFDQHDDITLIVAKCTGES
jgi:serine phosphatase RsbU (regulator of sigma subunit)